MSERPRDDQDAHPETDTRTEREIEREALPDPDELSDESEDPFEAFDDHEGTEATAEEIDQLFEPVETAEIDEEAVWEAILSEGDDDPVGATSEHDGIDAVVPKDQYCKRCEYFSEPPEVACTHPETEIVELVGVDRFRVSNCPIVAQRQRTQTIFPADR